MHPNEQLVWRLFDVIDRGEFDRFREFFTEDLHYERPRFPALTGVDRLITFYKDERIIKSGGHQIEHLVCNDTCGAAWGRYVGVTRADKPIDVIFADVYGFTGGLISSRRGYFFDAGEKL